MKTPDKLKKALECRAEYADNRCRVQCTSCPHFTPGYTLGDLVEDSVAYIRQLEAQVPKWISVEERLPEPRKTVMVVFKDGFMTIGHWDRKNWYVAGSLSPQNSITHWMPLPEPPKEDEE